MPEITQNPIVGREYRFLEDGFTCKDYPDPVRYEAVTSVTSADGSGCFDISFTTQKGKRRKVEVILNSSSQIEPLRALLLRKMPGASAHTRPQTAWEACGTWVTAGLSLAAIVAAIIPLNTWGRGATVLVIFGVGAALSLRKRKTVWEITR